ncbi:hypothetical protein, partial [Epibacterium ulvae]|uniref:hypothetical protein n=1 Tax=Epibacterium ulvae TaxID=1156985 RepID=UPI001E4ED7DC
AKTHKTAPPVLPASVPSSPNPPTNKGIESAKGHSIKDEFFNKISPQRKSSFFTASARSAEISASARLGVPHCGCKLGRSNIMQRGLAGQLTCRGI